MERTNIANTDVALTTHDHIPHDTEATLFNKTIKTLCQRLHAPLVPTLLANTLREGLAIACATAQQNEQKPYFITHAHSFEQLTLSQIGPTITAGPLTTAFLNGGLLVLTNLHWQAPTLHQLLPLLAGSPHLDLPLLATTIQRHPQFRTLLVLSQDNPQPPKELHGFIQAPVKTTLPNPKTTSQALHNLIPDASQNTLKDIATLLAHAQQLHKNPSLYHAQLLAQPLLDPTPPNHQQFLQKTQQLLGKDIAQLIEDQQLLAEFRKLETDDLLDELKREIE